jgi:hypothetical protein
VLARNSSTSTGPARIQSHLGRAHRILEYRRERWRISGTHYGQPLASNHWHTLYKLPRGQPSPVGSRCTPCELMSAVSRAGMPGTAPRFPLMPAGKVHR